ncbi:hypothetical protein PV-S19_0281 [Pacmanvirus S19]|nr:hypothetical protein PV-S19_0281 [Pacmanvirus S19]
MNLILFIIILLLLFVILAAMFAARTMRGYTIITGGVAKNRTKDLSKFPRSKSEHQVIEILESIVNEKFPTVYPKWLVWRGHNLELDGYCEKYKLGLEFSGPLHTKWYPEKEPYTKYFERIVRDVVKRKLCKKNKVNLIVIDMSLPRIHWRNYLLSRLYDVNFVSEKPIQYIEKQVAKPYRNEHLEKELGLECEMICAKKIK